jgi:hypothetical protein
MKVAINTRPKDGPWGGGNRFVASISRGLAERGDSAVFDLADDDIDVILLVDPRPRNPQVSFSAGAAIGYVDRHPRTLVAHRINECDERKDTRTMNARLRIANRAADHTIFIASWLKELDVWTRRGGTSVILNGADESEFPRNSARQWDGREPLRLVTHHWGAHGKKGWDVYFALDRLLGEPRWRDKLSFTYVGNAPADAATANIVVRPPLGGEALTRELAAHHIYISASQNEPAGMHHIEGAMLGLPLIYRNSGALPEYCSGYGESFEGPADVEAAILRMLASYSKWRQAIVSYDKTGARMVSGYLDLFERLVASRDAIAAERLSRGPLTRILNRLPI